jgi:two-component system, OmpR family, sensor kinase
VSGRISYRGLIIVLYLGSLVPLLVVMGLLVYGIQQAFLINDTRSRLNEFVQAAVEPTTVTGDTLSRLAVSLGDTLRVLGADVFVKDAEGNPVPPALGTGPWLDDSQHQQALASKTGVFQRLTTPDTDRLVYLAPILDDQGEPLGTVEASLTLQFIENELASLRRWLLVVVGGASALAVLLSLVIAEIARRPIDGLVRTAGRVAQGDINSRAPLPGVAEVRRLSMTFNTMLDRIQSAMNAQEQINAEMRRFAADASHELRSPLAVFRNGVEMLDKALARQDHEQVEGVLVLLRKETDSMTRLVDDLLFLARIESTSGEPGSESLGLEMALSPIEPLPLLEEVWERAQVLSAGQHLELVWPDTALRPILGDRDLLRRALNNLVENAIHHTPPGKNIYLSIQGDQNDCRFLIRDEGTGIPADDLPRIFERFYRGDTARNRRLASTGLGLAITRAIVYAHDGEIQVKSLEGEGTTFTITLPYQKAAAPQRGQLPTQQ